MTIINKITSRQISRSNNTYAEIFNEILSENDTIGVKEYIKSHIIPLYVPPFINITKSTNYIQLEEK